MQTITRQVLQAPEKMVKCESCEIDFFKRNYEIKNTKHNYCSEKCAIKGRIKPLSCRYCGSSNLVKNNNSSVGYRRICKECMIKQIREIEKKRIANKRCMRCNSLPKTGCKLCQDCLTKDTKRQANKRRDNKKRAVLFLGGKCKRCGLESIIMDIYDFHHNTDEKETEITKILNKSFERIKKELEKCILLCANCHRLTHFEENHNEI